MKLADGYELDPAVPLADLRPHPKNPNQGDVGAIVESIETVGFYGTVTAQKPRNGRKHGRILAGEHRWRAAQAENADTIPVSWLDVDDDTALRILLADNQIARLALLDQAAQAAQAAALTALAGTEQGLAGTGSDADDLDNLLRELADQDSDGRGDGAKDKTDPDAPEMTAEGDLWTLGRHRLICDDAFDPATLVILTAGQRVGMVFTDPPYGMHLDTTYSGTHQGAGDYRTVEGDDRPFDAGPLLAAVDAAEQFWWGADYYRSSLPVGGGWIVWDKRSREGETEFVALDAAQGSQFELCWSKQAHRREIARILWNGWNGLSDDDTTERVHPTQKPVRLVRWFLDRYQGDPVLDLFGGSGSTLIACEDAGRTCLMAELDPRYCDLIAKRWADYTGQTPELNGTPRPIE